MNIIFFICFIIYIIICFCDFLFNQKRKSDMIIECFEENELPDPVLYIKRINKKLKSNATSFKIVRTDNGRINLYVARYYFEDMLTEQEFINQVNELRKTK